MAYCSEPLSIDYNAAHNIPKPPLPYLPGTRFHVARHHPPPPPMWARVSLKYETAHERKEVDILTRCLRHPPTEGTTLPHESLDLQMQDTIRAADGKSAQLVTMRVLSGSLCGHKNIVAKFYDPLYDDHYSDNVDPFLCADREYRREVAAYTRLSTSDSVTWIPKYYGSYSLEIPVRDKSRFVRLILIEKIEGTAMNKLNPQDFSLHQRQAIMKGILDVEIRGLQT